MKKDKDALGIIGIIVAVISLVVATYASVSAREANRLAVEANDIAREQLPARVVVVNSNENLMRWSHAEGEPGTGETACNFSFLIANLGKETASIVGFRTDVSFGGGSMRIGSQTSTAIDEAEPLRQIHTVEVRLLSKEYIGPVVGSRPPDDILLSPPIMLTAGQKLVVFSWLLYTTYLVDMKNIPSNYVREGYFPVEAVYTFILHNG